MVLNEYKATRTTTIIDNDDMAFIKKNNIKVSELIRGEIKKRRGLDTGEIDATLKKLSAKTEVLQNRVNQIITIAKDYISEDKWEEFFLKI